MTKEEEIRRGNRARQLLEDELFTEAFSNIRKELLCAWEESPARDLEGREKIYLSLKALNKIQGYFTQIAETGKLASFNPKEN